MKKRISLIILYALSAMGGNALAEDFNSLDVIINLTRQFSDYHKKHPTNNEQNR